MKKRKFFLPHDDAVEFKDKKIPKPEENFESGGGVKKNEKVDFDWLMIQKLEGSSTEVPYLGRVINDGGPIKHRPINHDPDLKTAVLMVPFSPVNPGGVFKVSYVDATTGGELEVKFSLVVGNFEAIRAQFPAAEIIAEIPGESFSVKLADGTISSYLKTDSAEAVVFASYGSADAFTALGWHFLVRP